MFRQRPAELFFEQALKKNIGVIVRVPLASGLLTGKFTKSTTFGAEDHRQFNRNGEAFDKGETFSGIPYDIGLKAVEEIKEIFPNEKNLAPLALKWILDHDAVSTIIPGASNPNQVISNLEVFNHLKISDDEKEKINEIYTENIKPMVHQLW